MNFKSFDGIGDNRIRITNAIVQAAIEIGPNTSQQKIVKLLKGANTTLGLQLYFLINIITIKIQKRHNRTKRPTSNLNYFFYILGQRKHADW